MIVSVILPIRNEEAFIDNTLKSIINQKFDGILEIIVADGMSNDGTVDIVKKYQKKNKNIEIVENINQIVSTGFNLALTIARGNIIIRVDGHAVIAQGFISNCIKLILSKDIECVGGPIKHYSSTKMGNYVSTAQASKFGAGGASFRTGIKNGHFVNTLAFGAYKRDTFNQIGGYDEELVRNQDEELNYRLIQNGGKIWIDPSIKSIYYVRNSFSKLLKQYFYYGFYKVRVIQKIKAIFSWRHIIPSLFVIAILTSIWLYYFFKIKVFCLLLFPTYLFLSIAFSIYESHKQNFKPMPLLPFIFLSMHLAYGIGFILGFIYFINKWFKTSVEDNNFDKDYFNQNFEE